MAAIAGTLFFLAAFVFAGWVIVDSIGPRMARIRFLLQYGAVIDQPLPGPGRAMLRGRPVPMRVTVPARIRAAA